MPRQEPIRVVLADDHALFRHGLRKVLEASRQIEIVGEASTGEEATSVVQSLAPDVVLLDVSMPGISGIEAAKIIATASPRTRIIILTVHADDEYLFEAIKVGATGYLLKDCPPDALLDAVKVVHRGEAILQPSLAAKVLREFARAPEHKEIHDVLTPLTDRELEILRLVAGGLANKEIGHKLGISERTVKNHLSNIMNKLHTNSRTQAAVYALRTGMIRLD
ncbi:MAG: response regulator transcription factor [Armatimonadetes bacterium]|nr:response regulator transcription factor [Armatimonadota bacterium]